MDGFRCEEVTAAAEQLREIVNLFVVPPENLPSLMEQGRLSEMAKEVGTVVPTLLAAPSGIYSSSSVSLRP